jgi:Flp pilus assembly protein TadB
MPYAVNSLKTFKTFDSISEALEYQGKTVGTSLCEQDMFGNLKKLSDDEIAKRIASEKEAAAIAEKHEGKKPVQPIQPTGPAVDADFELKYGKKAEQQNPQEQASQKQKIIRYIVIFWLAAFIIFFIVWLVWPLFKEMWGTMGVATG